MPNRILRDWTDSIENRIKEIELLQKGMPKVKNGNPLQAVKFSLSSEKRRLKIRLSRLNGKSHTLNQAIKLINSVGGKCEICGKSNNPSIDHIIPISKGGHDGIENLRVLCVSCNAKKGGKHGQN